jgi:hypothetical protein
MDVQLELRGLKEDLKKIGQRTDLAIVNDHVFTFGPLSQSGPYDLTIGTLIHGNEPGGLYAVRRFLNDLLISNAGISKTVCILVGNLGAAQVGQRFIQRDLNRCFGGKDGTTSEEALARALEPFLERSKFYIDLHQTIGPTKSDFYIFPAEKSGISWAHNLSPGTPIIAHGKEFSKDGMCSDSYVVEHGGIGITYEMGTIGRNTVPVMKTAEILSRAYQMQWTPLWSVPPTIFSWADTIYSGPEKALVPGLVNFSEVKTGELLGLDQGRKFFANDSGFILFPKYGESAKAASELCRIIKKVPTAHLAEVLQPDFVLSL